MHSKLITLAMNEEAEEQYQMIYFFILLYIQIELIELNYILTIYMQILSKKRSNF